MFSSGDVCFGWSNILLFEKRVSKTKKLKNTFVKNGLFNTKKEIFC